MNHGDFVSRVILALTAKTFYEAYETAYGKMKDQPVALNQRVSFVEDGRNVKMHLGTMLASWASPTRGLWYWPDRNRWVTIQQWARICRLYRIAGKRPGMGLVYRTIDRV